MRCYFMRGGHIAGVEELPGLSDEEAVKESRVLFEARRVNFACDGFEVWEKARVVAQHPPAQTAEGKRAPNARDLADIRMTLEAASVEFTNPLGGGIEPSLSGYDPLRRTSLFRKKERD
jgi:hypothetical protein